MRAPMSRMDILSDSEINHIIEKSKLSKKYNNSFDRESAYEILTAKLERLEQNQENKPQKETAKSNSKNQGRDLSKGFLKVVTSATFIRGAFGILSKIISNNSKKK
jgi:hypothetical protein